MNVLKLGLSSMIFVAIFSISSCLNSAYKLQEFTVEKPVDTASKKISVQERTTYQFTDLSIDNEFPGARLNACKINTDGSYTITIEPENSPINPSPFYAFRVKTDRPVSVQIALEYTESKHRYFPKISHDRKVWTRLDPSQVQTAEDKKRSVLSIDLPIGTTFIAGQEIESSEDNEAWVNTITRQKGVRKYVAGKSVANRDIFGVEIVEGDAAKKPAIVLLSRQHPPELTGYFAMKSFVEEILSDKPLSNAFRKKFRILLYPMVNPDGVDEGHWRHNLNGIDLNRDWTNYRQPEIRALVTDVIEKVKAGKNKVVLGIDFHSTQRDVYYTNTGASEISPFKDLWLGGIDEAFEAYKPDDQPRGIAAPTSKTWFYKQFQAEAVTYEIGDHTDRIFIDEKARVAAREMMKLLVIDIPE